MVLGCADKFIMAVRRITTSAADDDFGGGASQHFGDEKRNFGRLQCPYLDCFVDEKLLGDVVDLSASGVRVFRRGRLKWRIGDAVKMTLKWREDEVEVTARILRVQKLGFRRYDLGIEFVDLALDAQSAIAELSRGARFALQFMTHRDVA